MTFQQYRRKELAELRPWAAGDDMSGVSVSQPDREAGSPKDGDMIARNPKNHNDKWLVAAQYFADNFEGGAPDVPQLGATTLKGDRGVATLVLALMLKQYGRPLIFPEAMLDDVAGLGLIIRKAGEALPGFMVAYLVTEEEARTEAAAAGEPISTGTEPAPPTDKSKLH